MVPTKFGRLDAESSLLQSFAWGLNLSGSLQGAGGVGGLLMVTDQTTINNQPSTHFPAYDGNGNVVVLVAAASGTVSATYEYGPFSEVVRQTGPMAHANKFRFSTKYQDDESEYLYYGYRSYNPSTGRWLSRDPIGEKGGLNLYGFVGNDPIGHFDKKGLFKWQEIGTRVLYSCNCGWLDFNHVQSGGLYQRIDKALSDYEANRSNNEFKLSQGNGSGIDSSLWSVTYRLTYSGSLAGKSRLELECGIFMHFQKSFEGHQGTIMGGGWMSGSSYSVEDLPSDFLGFMQAAGVVSDVKALCPTLSGADSLRMYWYGQGAKKNDSHVPKLWQYTGEGGPLGSDPARITNPPGQWTPVSFSPNYGPAANCDPCRGKNKKIPSVFTDFKCSFDGSKVTVINSDADYGYLPGGW